jgi:hypothetical protein
VATLCRLFRITLPMHFFWRLHTLKSQKNKPHNQIEAAQI